MTDVLYLTSSYQAARQGHENTVDILVQAGATLAGTDSHFATYVVKDAIKPNDPASLRIWMKAGWHA